jgi:uncharacterized protein
MTGVDLDRGLSSDELDELQAFLDREDLRDKALNVCMLEGYSAALVIGPVMVMPSQWMTWMWDADDGVESPEFEPMEQASRITGLIMRHYNSVAQAFARFPHGFVPLYKRDPRWTARDWCAGFLHGLQFAEEQWLALQQEELAWFTPFVMLGDSEMFEAAAGPDYVQRWEDAVPSILVQMHAYWLERREAGMPGGFDLPPMREPFRRAEPKTGRNEPCPCGSGRKYKKCCGADPTLH